MELPIILPFNEAAHREQVVELWRTVFGYATAHNDPRLSIEKKVQARDGLFFVGVAGPQVAGTILAGYDGHRGWLYSLAVAPAHRHRGLGTRLVGHAEQALAVRGCVKINLQILEGNEGVVAFYRSLGFGEERRISMGKVLTGGMRPEEP